MPKELNAEAINGARRQALGRCIIARVNGDVEIGILLLDCPNGTPQDPLASTAVVGVGMEESDGPSPLIPRYDHHRREVAKD